MRKTVLRLDRVRAYVLTGSLCAACLTACGGSTNNGGADTGLDAVEGDAASATDDASPGSSSSSSSSGSSGGENEGGADMDAQASEAGADATMEASATSGSDGATDGAQGDSAGGDASDGSSVADAALTDAGDGGVAEAGTSDAASPGEAGNDAGADASGAADGATDATGTADTAPNGSGVDANPCGNGVLDTGEDCDLGAKNSDLFSSCSSTCTTTSLLLHLDASDPSGNGSIPADNTPMNAWVDLATGRSVVQATSADQPIFRTNGIGGEPAFQFDGQNTFFDADIDINASVLPNVTIVVVLQNIANDPYPYSGVWGADLGGWGRFMSAVGTAGGNGVSNGGGFTFISGLSAAATPIVSTTILAGSTANGSSSYVNGVLGTTFTGSTNANDTRLSIGSLNGPNHFNSGYQEYGFIAEVLIYGMALSTTDRQTVEAALTTKY
jgi:hypothetical protein